MAALVSATEEQTDTPSHIQTNRSRLLWRITVIAVCLITSLAVTWPTAQYLAVALPLGTEREATVPIFNLWTLWWTADRVEHGFASYWDAPIFYPNRGVFTFSEPQPLTGLLAAPLWSVGAPLPLIYNLALLTLLMLNGLFAYRLARSLEIPRLAALLAGVLTVALPFVAKILGVLQLTALFGMLWSLEGFVRFGQTGRTRWAIWAGVGFVATYLTCQQYALMFALFALSAGVVALAQQGFRRAAILRLGGAGLGAGLIILVIALPALNLHRELGLARDERLVQALSARPSDLLTRPDDALVPIPPSSMADTAGLFPGLILSILAIAGGSLAMRDLRQRRWGIFLAASTIAAGLLALGLNLSLLGWRPFATLRAVIPGFDGLRSPFRFAALMQLGLPILAAFALAQLRRSVLRGGAILVIALTLLGVIDNLSIQPKLAAIPATPRTAWTTWLRTQPETTVVAHVPFPADVHVAAYESEALRMIAQIDHHKPLVNGYSGYFPRQRTPTGEVIPVYTQFQLAMAEEFPSYPLMCVLIKGLGVNTLVVEQAWLREHQSQMDAQRAFLEAAYQDHQVQIYRIAAPADACQSP